MDALEKYVDRDLGRLSTSECLWIWRKRQPSRYAKGMQSRQSITPRLTRRMTRAEAAEELGLTVDVYAGLEVGDVLLTPDERERIRSVMATMAMPTIGELCTVARRRSRGRLTTIEHALGVSRPKAIEMERYGAAPMVRYWEECGFKFPKVT